MKIKIVMDSGKNYELNVDSVERFQQSLINDIGVIRNTFLYLNKEETV